MRNTLLISLGLGLLATAAHAQADFRPGYIVTLAGDTVRGQADYRGALRSGRLCRFRPTADATPTSYRPAELRAYGFAGEKEYRTALTPLPDSLGQPQPAQRFFLELLATGPLSLLARRDRNDDTHYYLQKDPADSAPVKELIYRRELVETATSRYYRNINIFYGPLGEALADCPSVAGAVTRTPFKPQALTELVNRYNRCRQPEASQPLRTKKSHFSLGIVAGAQVSQLTFRDGDFADGHFVADPAPVLGLALQLVNPAINEKLAFRLEVQYAQQQYDDEYQFASVFAGTSKQTHFKLAYLRVPVLLRYTAPHGWVRPLLELGVAVNTALRIETEVRSRYLSTQPYSAGQPAIDEANLRTLEIGVLAGAGVQLGFPASRPISLLGRVERTNGFITALGFDNYVWRYQVLLGINLTK